MNRKKITQSVLLSLFSMVKPSYADDIDVYVQPPNTTVSPNIMFVLDRSGSMHSGNPSRIDRLKSAMTSLLNADDTKEVNAGIMSYSTRGQHMIKEAGFQKVGPNKASMINRVDAISAGGGTPTVPALDAAVKWYQGEYAFGAGPVEPSPFGNIPENNWCRVNQIVLLSDGSPNSNHFSNFPGLTPCNRDPFQGGGRCSQEIVKWARDQDFKTGPGWDIGLSEGKVQNIVTHTIGFDTPTGSHLAKYLQGIADSGGGKYYPASSSADLLSAFSSIASEGQTTVDYTYSAPVIPYNPDHTAVTGKYIYVPLLKPWVNTFWRGNLKKYKITSDASGVTIRDNNNQAVVNTDYTFASSIDLWSTNDDGADPLTNGAARLQDSSMSGSRKLYSNIDPMVVDLTHANNRVHRNNLNLITGLLDVSNANDREDLLKWINWRTPDKGFLVGADLLKGSMGASIHSQPTVVRYSASKDVVLISGSDGVLKAIDANTGKEIWSFIPKDMLTGIKKIALNASSTTPHYGLDGAMTVFNIGVKKYVVIGMRRGGHAYYALDITDRTQPKFAWRINNSGLFSQLGQTWSKPMFVKMHLSNSDQDVLVFGGGYDADQDTTRSRVIDDEGNAIFIVNPQTGALIKKISNKWADLNIPAMTNSIAGDLLPVDINANGVIDRLYAADVGGRIIRVDIPDAKFKDKTLSGAVIADINSGGGGFKRFFNTPEVGYFSKNGNQYLSILIGSGQRPKPLADNVIDRFYMIKDEATWKAPFDDTNHNGKRDHGEPFNYHTVQAYERQVSVSNGTLISVNNGGELYNATANLIQNGTATEKQIEKKLLEGEGNISSAKGWFIDLSIGEKSMSKARLYNHAVLFTTYSGTRSSVPDLCAVNTVTGTSKFYAIDMSDATALISDYGKSQSLHNISDRFVNLNIAGIPPSSTLTFGEDGTVRTMIGIEEILHFDDKFHAISWESVNE